MLIKTVAIVANPKNDAVGQVLQKVVDKLKSRRVDILLDKRAADALELNWHTPVEEISARADFIIVLGGDGTILSAARISGEREIPLLPVHMGRLGYITEFNVEDIPDALEDIFKGQMKTQKRMRLCCEILNSDGEVVYKEHALNEVALIKGGIAKMIEFDVSADGAPVNHYMADGFIVATPTGSTGYALSTGGPVIDPRLELILLSAICPHSLAEREVIADSRSVISIQIAEERQDIFVSQDGQVGRNLRVGESLVIKKAPFHTVLYRKGNSNFYAHLRDKLLWGK
jgi:NAD+ kinase